MFFLCEDMDIIARIPQNYKRRKSSAGGGFSEPGRMQHSQDSGQQLPGCSVPVVFQRRNQQKGDQEAQEDAEDDQDLETVRAPGEQAGTFPGFQEHPAAKRTEGYAYQAGNTGKDSDIGGACLIRVSQLSWRPAQRLIS